MGFKVKFKYYQYNSGRGDNGTKDCVADFNSLEDARHFKTIVNKYLDKSISDDEKEWLDDLLISYVYYAGYIVSLGDTYAIVETKIE